MLNLPISSFHTWTMSFITFFLLYTEGEKDWGPEM